MRDGSDVGLSSKHRMRSIVTMWPALGAGVDAVYVSIRQLSPSSAVMMTVLIHVHYPHDAEVIMRQH